MGLISFFFSEKCHLIGQGFDRKKMVHSNSIIEKSLIKFLLSKVWTSLKEPNNDGEAAQTQQQRALVNSLKSGEQLQKPGTSYSCRRAL